MAQENNEISYIKFWNSLNLSLSTHSSHATQCFIVIVTHVLIRTLALLATKRLRGINKIRIDTMSILLEYQKKKTTFFYFGKHTLCEQQFECVHRGLDYETIWTVNLELASILYSDWHTCNVNWILLVVCISLYCHLLFDNQKCAHIFRCTALNEARKKNYQANDASISFSQIQPAKKKFIAPSGTLLVSCTSLCYVYYICLFVAVGAFSASSSSLCFRLIRRHHNGNYQEIA